MRAKLAHPRTAAELKRITQAAPGEKDPLFGWVENRTWLPVALYPAASDGAEVTVSILRLPAVSYRVQCPELGVDLATGIEYSIHELIHTMAEALASGMLAPVGRRKDEQPVRPDR